MEYIYFAQSISNPNFIKIGQSNNVPRRMFELRGSFPDRHIICVGKYENKKSDGTVFTDRDFHYFLKTKGYKVKRFAESNRDSECFEIGLSVLIDEFYLFTKITRPKIEKLVLTDQQSACLLQLQISALADKHFGIFLQPRSGKTIICLKDFDILTYNCTAPCFGFYVSARTDPQQPVIEDYDKYNGNFNYNLIEQKNFKKHNSLIETSNNLINVSMQFLNNINSLEELQEIFPGLTKNNIEVIYIDEAHIAGTTSMINKLIKLLNPKYIRYSTGTPWSLLNKTNIFNNENTLHYSYIDECRDIELGLKRREDYPGLLFYKGNSPFINKKFQTLFVPQNKKEIKRWFYKTFGVKNGYTYSTNETIDGLKNFIFVLPANVKCCEFLYQLIREMNEDVNSPLYKQFHVVMAAGKNRDLNGIHRPNNNKLIYKQYNHSCETFDGFTIMVTLCKGLQSITYPECHGVIFWDDGESYDKYMQAVYRCKTPNKSRTKPFGYIFDYCGNRCLKIVFETIHSNAMLNGYIIQPNDKVPFKIYDIDLECDINTILDLESNFLGGIQLRRISSVLTPDYNVFDGLNIPEMTKVFSNKFQITKNKITNDVVRTTIEPNENVSGDVVSFKDKLISDLKQANEKIALNGGVGVYKIENLYYNFEKNRYEYLGWYDFKTEQFMADEIIFGFEEISYHGGSRWKLAQDSKLLSDERKGLTKDSFISILGKSRDDDTWSSRKKLIERINLCIDILVSSFPFIIYEIYEEDYQNCKNINDFMNMLDNNADIFEKYTKIDYQVFKSHMIKAYDEYTWNLYILKSINMIKDTYKDKNNFFEWLNDDHEVIKNIPQEVLNFEEIKNEKFDISIFGGIYTITDNLKLYVSKSYKEKFVISKLYPNLKVICIQNSSELLHYLKNEGKNMKFDNIISNPPYNNEKSTIYVKCILEMLNLSDKVTVICPDKFKKTREIFDKVSFYSHLGNVWNGVGADVSIFKLNNNHHSLICKTPNGTYSFYKEEQRQDEEKIIIKRRFNLNHGDWTQYQLNELNENDFVSLITQVKREAKSGSRLKETFPGFSFSRTGHSIKPIKAGQEITSQSYIIKCNNNDEANNLFKFFNTRLSEFICNLMLRHDAQGRPIGFPIPDVKDNNIGNDEYLCHLYNISNDEFECIKNNDFDKFIELNQE